MKILVIFGTRPEAIKTAPLILELKKYPDCQVQVCFTGTASRYGDAVHEAFRH